MWLLGQVVKSFSTDGAPGVGLPLGNLTSQLFGNLYLNVLDRFAKHRLKAQHYIRYADDFVFLHEDRAWLEEQIPKVAQFLQERLHLQLHPNKVMMSTFTSGVDFLGWVHFADNWVLRTATKRRMMRRLKEYAKDEALQSYLGLLSHGNTYTLQKDIRMEYWLCNET